jgi:hypothetical protein
MGIPFTLPMGFLFTMTPGILFTIALGIQLTISNFRINPIKAYCKARRDSQRHSIFKLGRVVFYDRIGSCCGWRLVGSLNYFAQAETFSSGKASIYLTKKDTSL